MSSVASWSDGVHEGFAVALGCAEAACEKVHVSTFATAARTDQLTASVIGRAEAEREGWRRGHCPEHAEAAS